MPNNITMKLMENNRIQINGIWYVKEGTIKKPTVEELDPTHFEGYVVENDDYAFEATRIFRDNGTPYNGVDIEVTTKKGEKKDWTVDHWDNDTWMKGILENDEEAWEGLPEMSQDNILFLQAFLQFLKDKNWL